MGSRFIRKSWFRLKPLIEQKVIPEPTWFKAAEAFPPFPPPELKGNRDIRDLFPEEVERKKIDEKYQVEQNHALRETEKGAVYGREELRKKISVQLQDQFDVMVAWKMAVGHLKTKHSMDVRDVEEELKRERLLKLKNIIP